MEPESALLLNYLIVGGLLFGIGLIGFLSRRNMIVMLLAVQMMLQGVSLSLVAWGRFHNDFGGQMLVIFIIAAAACQAAIALALILMLFRRRGSLDVAPWHALREEVAPPCVDRELPEEPPAAAPAWPRPTPAGRAPPRPPDQTDHRSDV